MARLDLDRIKAAVPRISQVFRNTPQYECDALSAALRCGDVLKVETLNPIRCFKGRGTETVMSRLAEGARPKSAVCASAGILGQSLAYSGRLRQLPTTVVAAAAANPLKIERIRAPGRDGSPGGRPHRIPSADGKGDRRLSRYRRLRRVHI